MFFKKDDLKNKYKNLKEELLDIKNKAIVPNDEEMAEQRFNYLISCLRTKAAKGEELSESVYVGNEHQLVLITEMLVSEGLNVDTRNTSLKDSPYRLTASVLDEQLKLVQ